jgi:ankyrin repeat protein
MHGDLTKAQQLLNDGAEVNDTDCFGSTPLYQAAATGHFDVVQLLLQSGASIDKTDVYGMTPLYAAAQRGHLQVVELLLHHNANPVLIDEDGKTALMAVIDTPAFIHTTPATRASILRALLDASIDRNKRKLENKSSSSK